MRNLVKKMSSLVVALVMLLSSILPISSYAYNENDLKAWVKDNYWVELENYNNNLVPKGVNIAKTSFGQRY